MTEEQYKARLSNCKDVKSLSEVVEELVSYIKQIQDNYNTIKEDIKKIKTVMDYNRPLTNGLH